MGGIVNGVRSDGAGRSLYALPDTLRTMPLALTMPPFGLLDYGYPASHFVSSTSTESILSGAAAGSEIDHFWPFCFTARACFCGSASM